MKFWLITTTLTIVLAIQIFAVFRLRRAVDESAASGENASSERSTRSPAGLKLEKPSTDIRASSKAQASEVVANFLEQARKVDNYVGARPNSAEIARRIKSGEIIFADEVSKIAKMRTAYAREEAATALMNAFLMLTKTQAMGGLIPEDDKLSALLATDCPEERGVWALVAGFSADSAVRFRVVQLALGDSNEFVKSGALWACSTGMAELKEAQEAVLRASRNSGQRHQVVAVAGLESLRAEGAVTALLDAAGDRDSNVRATAESALARRAAWDEKAAAGLGTLLQGKVSSQTAKRIWNALASVNALSRLSTGDRETLERLRQEKR